jgi:hypothetical protein
MKSRILSACCLLAFAIGFTRSGLTQGCSLDMNPSYGTYQSASSNGTTIYTDVLVDGSANCQPSAACNCSGAVHTPKAYNKIGSVGGWGSGTAGCVNCYLSYRNDQSIIASPEY